MPRAALPGRRCSRCGHAAPFHDAGCPAAAPLLVRDARRRIRRAGLRLLIGALLTALAVLYYVMGRRA